MKSHLAICILTTFLFFTEGRSQSGTTTQFWWDANVYRPFARAGIEFEHHKNLAIFRVGVDGPLHLGNGWLIVPSFAYDLKGDYDTARSKFLLERVLATTVPIPFL